MIYLQLSLLALGAILLNYNLMISMLCIVIFLLITWKNKNLNARKTIICLIVFLAFFIRGAYEQKTNTTHISDEKNIEKVLLELNGQKSKAKFVSVIALVKPDGTELTFRGECHGEIIFEKRGTNGFGYDPIFYVPSLEKTFAELSSDEKNSISHRKESLEKFSNFLKEENNEN